MAGAPTPFRQILENRLSQLAAETELLFADARQRARGELADELNQAARRLFQAEGAEELASTLASVAAGYASAVLVFRVEGEVARSPRIDVPLSAAAAFAGAMQTRDPVIAAATPGEVSAGPGGTAGAFGGRSCLRVSPGGRAKKCPPCCMPAERCRVRRWSC